MQHCLHLPSKNFIFVFRLILPNKSLNVLAYGCTSAAATIGEQTIFDQLSKREVNYMCVMMVFLILILGRCLQNNANNSRSRCFQSIESD